MNEHGKHDNVDGTPEGEELGISTGLMEWIECAPWVIRGRFVSKSGREKLGLSPLSGYQVELPSRRGLMQRTPHPENTEQCPTEPVEPDRPAEPPKA